MRTPDTHPHQPRRYKPGGIAAHRQAQKRLDTPPQPADIAAALVDIEVQRQRSKAQEQRDRANGLASTDLAWGGGLLEVGLELFGMWLEDY